MDSLDFSKQFPVLTVSRLDLLSLGIPYEQVKHLSDADMQTLADQLKEQLETYEFQETVKFTASTILVEKEH